MAKRKGALQDLIAAIKRGELGRKELDQALGYVDDGNQVARNRKNPKTLKSEFTPTKKTPPRALRIPPPTQAEVSKDLNEYLKKQLKGTDTWEQLEKNRKSPKTLKSEFTKTASTPPAKKPPLKNTKLTSKPTRDYGTVEKPGEAPPEEYTTRRNAPPPPPPPPKPKPAAPEENLSARLAPRAQRSNYGTALSEPTISTGDYEKRMGKIWSDYQRGDITYQQFKEQTAAAGDDLRRAGYDPDRPPLRTTTVRDSAPQEDIPVGGAAPEPAPREGPIRYRYPEEESPFIREYTDATEAPLPTTTEETVTTEPPLPSTYEEQIAEAIRRSKEDVSPVDQEARDLEEAIRRSQQSPTASLKERLARFRDDREAEEAIQPPPYKRITAESPSPLAGLPANTEAAPRSALDQFLKEQAEPQPAPTASSLPPLEIPPPPPRPESPPLTPIPSPITTPRYVREAEAEQLFRNLDKDGDDAQLVELLRRAHPDDRDEVFRKIINKWHGEVSDLTTPQTPPPLESTTEETATTLADLPSKTEETESFLDRVRSYLPSTEGVKSSLRKVYDRIFKEEQAKEAAKAPSIEDLESKPTARSEISKNFSYGKYKKDLAEALREDRELTPEELNKKYDTSLDPRLEEQIVKDTRAQVNRSLPNIPPEPPERVRDSFDAPVDVRTPTLAEGKGTHVYGVDRETLKGQWYKKGDVIPPNIKRSGVDAEGNPNVFEDRDHAENAGDISGYDNRTLAAEQKRYGVISHAEERNQNIQALLDAKTGSSPETLKERLRYMQAIERGAGTPRSPDFLKYNYPRVDPEVEPKYERVLDELRGRPGYQGSTAAQRFKQTLQDRLKQGTDTIQRGLEKVGIGHGPSNRLGGETLADPDAMRAQRLKAIEERQQQQLVDSEINKARAGKIEEEAYAAKQAKLPGSEPLPESAGTKGIADIAGEGEAAEGLAAGAGESFVPGLGEAYLAAQAAGAGFDALNRFQAYLTGGASAEKKPNEEQIKEQAEWSV